MMGRRTGSRVQVKRARAQSRVYRLSAEALEPRQLLATFLVTNLGDNAGVNPGAGAGTGTFRQAIIDANALPGRDTIQFAIGGSGVRTINVLNNLPTIVDPVVIDGTSQPGYVNQPVIEVNGTSAGVSAVGLQVRAASTIRGLSINRFGSHAILVEASGTVIQRSYLGTDPTGQIVRTNGGSGVEINNVGNVLVGGVDVNGSAGNVISGNSTGIVVTGNSAIGNQIKGNVIGLNATGTAGLGNTFNGITIQGGVSGTQIGGVLPTDRNIISGNAFDQISLFGLNLRDNTIQGNYIGTDITGSVSISNFQGIISDGIVIDGFTTNTLVGGTQPGAGNVISGLDGRGIWLFGFVYLNRIEGNFIGVAADGVSALGNQFEGIEVSGFASVNTIGGYAPGAGNIIANNGFWTFSSPGVTINANTSGNAVLSNSIYNNVLLGIDLRGDGPTANDAQDPDIGPNRLQNYPIVTSARTGGGRTVVQGQINSTPNSSIVIQFFANETLDPSGFGEGQYFLGSTTVTTDSNGDAAIDVTLGTPVQVGQYVTATATDLGNNTSEFSPGVQAEQGVVTDLAVSLVTDPEDALQGSPLTYTVTVTNNGPDDATNVTLTDVLPGGVTIDSFTATGGATVQQFGQTVVATYPSLLAGQSETLTIIVTPTQTGVLLNQAIVTSLDIDPDLTNNSVSDTTDVIVPADLEVRIDGNPVGQVLAGQNLVYTITVLNRGPGRATNVELTNLLPSDVAVLEIRTSQGTFTQQGSAAFISVVAKLGTIDPGIPAVVLLTVQPSLGATTSITSTAVGAEIDTVPANNTATLSSDVVAAADLEVVLIDSPSSALTGGTVQYSYQVTNLGPSPANSVVIAHILPVGLSYTGSTASIGNSSLVGNQVRFAIPTLLTNQFTTLTVTGTVTATAGVLTNVVDTQANEADPLASNDTLTMVTLVNPVELALDITVSPQPIQTGQPVIYTLGVTNVAVPVATADAQGVRMEFQLPAGSSVLQSTVTQGTIDTSVPGKLIANFGTITLASSAAMTVSLMPPAGVDSLNSQTRVFAANQEDLDPTNNVESRLDLVNPVDLALAIQGPAGPVGPGADVPFTFVVSNLSTISADSLNVSVPIPAGTTLVSATPGAGILSVAQVGDTVVASAVGLAAGAQAEFTLVLRPTALGNFQVAGQVSGTNVDPVPDNNSVLVDVVVANLPGTLSFSQAAFTTSDLGPNVLITVNRVGGFSGVVLVGYTAFAGTAVAGVDFTPVSGALQFLDGEATKSFLVPILRNANVTGNLTVNLALTSAGQGDIGPLPTAVLTIQDTDIDLTGPTVSNVWLWGQGTTIGSVVVQFTESMDPTSAQNVSNYTLRGANGLVVPIQAVVYTEATRSVNVMPAAPLAGGQFHVLTINGSTPGAVTDRFGNVIDGNGDNVQGGDFVAQVGRGSNLTFNDRDGDVVNLYVSGRGMIDVIRDATGQVLQLQASGYNSSSTLNGTVRRNGGDGRAHLGRLGGVGVFTGGIKSRLTTPPFTAENVVLSTTLPRPGRTLVPQAGNRTPTPSWNRLWPRG